MSQGKGWTGGAARAISGANGGAVRAVALAALLALSTVAAGMAAAGSGRPLGREEIRRAEERLAELGYWTGPVDGVWDAVSRHALVAFQKVEWRKRTGQLSRREYDVLMRALPPSPRESGGPHVEVDLERQVLFLVDAEGRAGNVLPISSGSGKTFRAPRWGEGVAVTPCGRLEIYSRRSGWHTSPLGEMHNPLYIVGGIAIHGSDSVPPYPASHGCIRVPLFASKRLPAMLPNSTPVLVYGCKEAIAR
jgi:N-acetylmuramoyl-L-alanine amidase